MALLAVLQPHAPSLARLRAAVEGEHELVICASWSEVADAVSGDGVEGCVLEMDVAGRARSFRELRRLRDRRPPLAVVVEGDFSGREPDLFLLGRIGLDGVVLAETSPTASAVRKVVEVALTRALAAGVVDALHDRLPGLAGDALRWAITHAVENPGAEDLARALGRSHATLARELRPSMGHSARRVLLWGRLFYAGRRLATGKHSIEAVALGLGYSSRTALSRALRRETGLPPTEVVRRGGVSCLLEAFRAGGSRGSGA